MKSLCLFAEVKPVVGRVPASTNQDKGGRPLLMKLKHLKDSIHIMSALFYLLAICALGTFAALVHWDWLDNKCSKALEE